MLAERSNVRANALGRRSPLLAGAMALFLLAFAGIPLTSGFMGKWAVFSAAWQGGAWPLVVIGTVISVVMLSLHRVVERKYRPDDDFTA